MTVAEAITKSGITPIASYTGIETADDFVFAIQTESAKQTKESAWIVCADHVKEHSGALNASTNSDTFIRTGPTDTKSATQRTLSVNGNRCVGDAFQDFLLSHKIKYLCLRRQGHWHPGRVRLYLRRWLISPAAFPVPPGAGIFYAVKQVSPGQHRSTAQRKEPEYGYLWTDI